MTKLAFCQYYGHFVNDLRLTLADVMDHVGKKIRKYRQLKGYTQQELADIIHKGRTLVSHIEQTGKVNHHTLLQICKALDVNYEELTSMAEEPFPPISSSMIHERSLLEAEIERLRNELLLKDEIIATQKAHIKALSVRKK